MFGRRVYPKQHEITENPGLKRTTELWSDGFGTLATRTLQLIIVLVLSGALILGLSKLSTVVTPVLLAVILASTFYPIMHWLRSRGVPSLLATLMVLFAIVLVLAGVIYMIVRAVISQWSTLQEQAEKGFEQFVELINKLPFEINETQLLSLRDTALDFVTSSEFGSGALAGVSAVGTGATSFVLLIVILFFFLKDGPAIWEFVCRPFNDENSERAQRIGQRSVQTFGSYVRGTATVAFVDAVGIGIGLAIMQVPLALPLSVLVFVLSFIPIVGAVAAGILAALVALVSNGLVSALIVVGIVILVNQLEGNLLQPVLMGRALKLHSLVILLALTVGTLISGILGAVLAVPLVAVVWGAIKVWHGEEQPALWARQKRQVSGL